MENNNRKALGSPKNIFRTSVQAGGNSGGTTFEDHINKCSSKADENVRLCKQAFPNLPKGDCENTWQRVFEPCLSEDFE